MVELGLSVIVGCLVIFIAVILGNAVGVGGAGIIVPALLLCFSLQVLEASAQSNFLIFIGFVIKYAQNFKQRHPVKNEPLVDYNLAVLLLPSSMLGTKLGIIIHDIVPQILTYLCLAITLMLLGYRSLSQGIRQYKQECSEVPDLCTELKCLTQESVDPSQLQLRREIEEVESQYVPLKKLILVIILIFFLSLSIIIEGGKGLDSIFGIEKCSTVYWTSIVGFAVICVCITLIACREIIYLQEKKKQCGMASDENNWTFSKVALLFSIGTGAGILSALFGIGGGIVLSPVLVELKVHPQAVASTGGFFVMLTTFSSSVVLVSQGKWDLYLGILTAIISIVASIISSLLTKKLLAHYKHPSILVITMAIIIIISSITISGIGFSRMLEKYDSLFISEVWQFHHHCS